MKKVFRLKSIVYGLIAILLVSTVLTLSCAKKEKEIKIGAILPLTGDAAIWGQNVKKGIEDVNNRGGVKGKKIRVIYEDSQGLPQNATSALHKLINADKVQAIIGEVASSSVLAMAPIAEKAKVVLLSPGASNLKITDAGEYTFRNWHSDACEGSYLAKTAYEKLNMRKMSIIYVNNAYGAGLEEVFSNEFRRLGGVILVSEGFEQNATDFRSQLTKIKDSQSNGIFMPGYPKEMPIVLKQAKELGIKARFLCPSAFEDEVILRVAGANAEGVIYVYPKMGDLSKKEVADFYKSYKAKYGIAPGALSDTGYDALKLIVRAMSTDGFSGPEIQRGLLKIRDYPGVAGKTTFDENGDIIKDFNLKVVKDGKFTDYK